MKSWLQSPQNQSKSWLIITDGAANGLLDWGDGTPEKAMPECRKGLMKCLPLQEKCLKRRETNPF